MTRVGQIEIEGEIGRSTHLLARDARIFRNANSELSRSHDGGWM